MIIVSVRESSLISSIDINLSQYLLRFKKQNCKLVSCSCIIHKVIEFPFCYITDTLLSSRVLFCCVVLLKAFSLFCALLMFVLCWLLSPSTAVVSGGRRRYSRLSLSFRPQLSQPMSLLRPEGTCPPASVSAWGSIQSSTAV